MRQQRRIPLFNGFTLVELVVVLALFSLVLLFCYQAFSTSVAVQEKVSGAIVEQTQLRAAYSALRSAIESGGLITGDARQLSVELSHASSRWLLDEGAQEVRFKLSASGELWQQQDGRLPSKLVLERVRAGQFSYLTAKGERLSQWQQANNPRAVILSGLTYHEEYAGSASSESEALPDSSRQWLFLAR